VQSAPGFPPVTLSGRYLPNPPDAIIKKMTFELMSRLQYTAIVLCLFIKPLHGWTQEKSQEEQILAILATQRKKIDSLNAVLARMKNNDRLDCYNLLSTEYRIISSDTSWQYASKAYDSSKTTGYYKGIIEGLLNLAQITQERGDMHGAEKFFRQATGLYPKDQDLKGYISARRRLGYNLYLQLRYDEARAIFEEILSYFKTIDDPEGMTMTHRVIGKSYNDQGYFEKAAGYFQKDMEITRNLTENGTRGSLFMWGNYYLAELYKGVGDKKLAIQYYRLSASRALDNNLPDIYNSRMGDIQELLEHYDSARFYYQKAFHLTSNLLIDPTIRSTFLNDPSIQIAKTYLQQRKYDSALIYLKTPLSHSSPPNIFTLRVLYYIATAYKGQKAYSESLEYVNKLLAIAQFAKARKYLCNGLELKWQIYHETGQKDSSYKYHLLFTALKDTLASDEQLRNMVVAQMRSENQLAESKIVLLSNEKKIEQQQKQLIIIAFTGIFLIVIAVYRNILLKRRNESTKRIQLENELKLQKLEAETTKAALHQQATELEMQALRAQMNPHFIFNSINSINRFILQNNKLQASEYLTKFSRLVRIVLYNSQSSLITLESELEALRLYLDLEAIRFEHHFTYTISCPEDMDIEILKVPPLILQPFVENAIWHGLMHKEEKGRLGIELSCQDEFLLVKITDDGIGRKRAGELKSKSATGHQSMGLKITTDRILMAQKFFDKEPPVKINDLVHADGSAAGTEVIIKIPIIYDQGSYN
jgi:tetratricopeptide (TPR) repeat protein